MTGDESPTERSFGITVGTALMLISGYFFWRGHHLVAAGLASAGGFLAITGLLAAPLLKPLNALWWKLATALGWLNSRIILVIFFVLILTPVGLLLRILGRSPLRLREPGTSWRPVPSRRADPRHFDRHF